MLRLILGTFLLGAISACGSSPTPQDAFVTKLGNDTLAVETFEKTATGMNAKVMLRSPKTSLKSYQLIMDNEGGIQQMTTVSHAPELGFSDEGSVIQTVVREGDSLKVETETNNGLRTRKVAYKSGTLPFIDMVHWPFELGLQAAKASGQDTLHQYLLSGNNISDFIIARIGQDSMTIRHPSRGVMGVDVDKVGNLKQLDAGLTTRKLIVYRESNVDIDGISKRFAQLDQKGNSFGSLSGAEVAEAKVHNADIRIEYGSPHKRNRAIFGGIVGWGQLWRTGANRATHFSTSKDLKIGSVKVPAGEYTLYSIPEADGGLLIINKQTGQTGTTYNQANDLARIPMKISKQDEVTEVFTIKAEEDGKNGVLKLIWDQTVFSVNFSVQ
tara:strand:+ start:12997 stop:14148 length:1152 start_codon:yes stop_codon:yes gene_type:complete